VTTDDESRGPAQLALADDLAGPVNAGLARPARQVTIGEVLEALKGEFPELTISKIRYYERQGLLTPARSAAGYRKFSPADVERLRYVLRAARDHYLPLKVIKDRLEAAEAQNARARENLGHGSTAGAAAGDGWEADLGAGPGDGWANSPPAPAPPALQPPGPPATPADAISPELFGLATSDERLTRRELLRESGLTGEQLTELEAYGLIAARGASTSYEAESLIIARIVAELSRYGLQARHLRPVKAAVDREVGLIEQVLTPLVRQPTREGRGKAEQHAREYAALSVRLHVALLEAALRAALR
jgi:DNA-binding transcriptional MerR regulator